MDPVDSIGGSATVSMDSPTAVAVQCYEKAIDTVVTEMAVYRLLPFGCVGPAELLRWMLLLKQARGENL